MTDSTKRKAQKTDRTKEVDSTRQKCQGKNTDKTRTTDRTDRHNKKPAN